MWLHPPLFSTGHLHPGHFFVVALMTFLAALSSARFRRVYSLHDSFGWASL
jgi:hypothetical protein